MSVFTVQFSSSDETSDNDSIQLPVSSLKKPVVAAGNQNKVQTSSKSTRPIPKYKSKRGKLKPIITKPVKRPVTSQNISSDSDSSSSENLPILPQGAELESASSSDFEQELPTKLSPKPPPTGSPKKARPFPSHDDIKPPNIPDTNDKEEYSETVENDEEEQSEMQINNQEEESLHEVEPEKPAQIKENQPIQIQTKCDENTNANILTDEEMVTQLKLRRLPGKDSTANLIPYQMRRETIISWHGVRTHYHLILNGQSILSTKIKSKSSTEIINVSEGADCHFSSKNYKAVILVGQNFSTFSLRNQNQFGEEIMNIKYTRPQVDFAPREVVTYVFKPPQGVPADLKNRKPVFTKAGTWILNLSGRCAKRSIKNCVMVDEDDVEYMSAVKASHDVLAVEMHPQISPLVAFALGISSFLCKL